MDDDEANRNASKEIDYDFDRFRESMFSRRRRFSIGIDGTPHHH